MGQIMNICYPKISALPLSTWVMSALSRASQHFLSPKNKTSEGRKPTNTPQVPWQPLPLIPIGLHFQAASQTEVYKTIGFESKIELERREKKKKRQNSKKQGPVPAG